VTCWTQPGHGPRTIPTHNEAVAILLCDRANTHASTDVGCFDAIIYFDEVATFIAPYPSLPSVETVVGQP
jgi:hypothetical protein